MQNKMGTYKLDNDDLSHKKCWVKEIILLGWITTIIMCMGLLSSFLISHVFTSALLEILDATFFFYTLVWHYHSLFSMGMALLLRPSPWIEFLHHYFKMWLYNIWYHMCKPLINICIYITHTNLFLKKEVKF